MQADCLKAYLRAALAISFLFAVAGSASAQTTVNLTAQRFPSARMSDGNVVPMWGWTCDAASTACSPLNTTGNAWRPVVIRATTGTSLTINLTNTLPTPTSVTIPGQVGGGLGNPVNVVSPVHPTKTVATWPINSGATFNPPAQPPRAESFVPEAPANGTTPTVYTWPSLKAGTYLIRTGTHPSIQGPMGLYGVLVVTAAPVLTGPPTPTVTPGTAYPGVTYDADSVLLFSEMDPRQNAAVDAVAATAVASSGTINETLPWNPTCAFPSPNPTCYPPAVNYTPLYYMVNGVSFDKSVPGNSTYQLPTAASSGNILLRFVNAGSRMHVPSVVGQNMSLIAEDGNPLPGLPKVQNHVFMAAGKVYDVTIQPPQTTGAYTPVAIPVFDRDLSLSTNNRRDGGMLAYVELGNAAAGTAGGTPPAVGAQAVNDYYTLPPNKTTFSANVLANDIGITTATLGTAPQHGTAVFDASGNFTYTPSGTNIVSDTFTYVGNGNNALTAMVTITVGAAGGAPVANADSYNSNVANFVKITRPGVLANDTDPTNYPLTAVLDTCSGGNCLLASQVSLNTDGSFTANPSAPGTYTFQYHAVNSQGTPSNIATVTLTFAKGSGVHLSVVDAKDNVTAVNDFRWILEEDDSYKIDPNAAFTGGTPPVTVAINFHHSHNIVVASGCVGSTSCGAGQTVYDPKSKTHVPVPPQISTTLDQVALDPTKAYYVSVLPGDAANPFESSSLTGHTMGGAPVATGIAPNSTVTAYVQPNPLQPAQLTAFVWEDDSELNGEIDQEEITKGLGGFQIELFDDAGATGDVTGQMTYDMFNMPLTNALAGTKDQLTGFDACPISASPLVGVIITCPNLESDGKTASPLAGQVIVKNLMPGRFGVVARPGAGRIAAGEEWIQTSTLDGTRALDSFLKVGEPAFFQEFGPPGIHVFMGFINPKHIEAQRQITCKNGLAPDGVPTPLTPCTNTVKGQITNLHTTRSPNENLYDSKTGQTVGSNGVDPARAALAATTCYVSLGVTDAPNIGFAKCDANGNFSMTGFPDGDYSVVVWDQWLDQLMFEKAVRVHGGQTLDIGSYPVFSWFTRLQTKTFIENGTDNPGIGQVPTRVRYRDGAISNTLLTDANGNAQFNELFPLFHWQVVESDTTRYKGTGVHVTYDAGGPVDTTGPLTGLGTSTETFSLPANRQVPGATYTSGSTSRVDPGTTLTEAFQGYVSNTEYIGWGKTPYLKGENGGISGTVVYGSTRPFDDPRMLFQNLWEPLVPRVTVNLYSETTGPDGTQVLKPIDTTQTSSWDDWVNGTNPATGMPNMNCPGQDPADEFFTASLGAANQYKCYDALHNYNQVQPAPYDGMYQFPTPNCAACVPNPASTAQNPLPKILPPGKYVAEVVVPPGYELVKEEDKNILIGDAFIAPVSQQFGTMSNIFIVPDQASLDAYNANNPNNQTNDLGRTSLGGFGPGGLLAQPAPCVGTPRIVPDYMSIFPGSQEVAPFAGALRNLCDRKEVTLEDQMQAKASFFIYTPTPKASNYAGIIQDDFTSEYDPTSPTFGEKFAVGLVPVAIRDFTGKEISRVYADQWGNFNGMVFSTWEVNPPNPTGYAPNMMTTCMNDPGPIAGPGGKMIQDPFFNPSYSNFCYENPFMPGRTGYLDTPVVPTSAFAAGYNPADCAYPFRTAAISRVDGNGQFGPYIDRAEGPSVLKITALGDIQVPNPAYVGPAGTTAPYNQKTITRHYGFGDIEGTVTIGGVQLTNVTWTDGLITATVPPNATTGELVITPGNGKTSFDTVTVTIEDSSVLPYRAPTYVTAGPLQQYLDDAQPGDLIIVGPGTYNEALIMWKPVRLQGVGAASTIINASTVPSQFLVPWRQKMNSLFGIDADGNTIAGLVPRADPLPGETITGIVLFEPSIMAASEGAGVTVVGKNLTAAQCTDATKDNTTNYYCYPSRIDGFSITGSSAGGGVYAHGWNHQLEVSNNRIYGNGGTVTGGIHVGQPSLADADGGLTGTGAIPPLKYDDHVHIHNNAVTKNAAYGDEFNVDANAAGGGIAMMSGSDNYTLDHNFVCGNFSTGNGGGIDHYGMSTNSLISHNLVVFNQSFNQTDNTSGGGIIVEGEPQPSAVEPGLAANNPVTDGTGNVTVDANIIIGNAAEAGMGGGIRLADVNGAEMIRNPTQTAQWWHVLVSNNIIADNVAGWAGGGVSVYNTVFASIVDNTIVHNDSLATAGVLFQPDGGVAGPLPTTSTDQPSGLSAEPYSSPFSTQVALTGQVVPSKLFANPTLSNNILWQNRTFHITVTQPANLIALVPALKQAKTGDCPAGAHYWDLGVLGDISPTTHESGFTLSPTFSILTNTTGYASNNISSDPKTVTYYCNGRRVPPELSAGGIQTTPGIPDLDPLYAKFAFIAGATLDEGNNWVNVRWGPLSLTNSSILPGGIGYSTWLGDYHIQATSPAKNAVSCANASGLASDHDVDGNSRPSPACTTSTQLAYDIGAHEYRSTAAAPILTISPTALAFASQRVHTSSTPQVVTLANTGTAALPINTIALSGTNSDNFTITHNCGTSLAAGAKCTASVVFTPNQYGLRSAALNESDSIGTQLLPLTGTGVHPNISILPTSLTLPAQQIYTTSAPQIVTVTNTSTAAITFTSIVFAGDHPAGFAQTNTCGTSLPAGKSCKITVTLTPPDIGPRGALMVLTDSGTIGPQNVVLSGTVVAPQADLTAATVAFGQFGNQIVGLPTAPQPMKLRNTGIGPLLINGTPPINFTGPQYANYSQTNNCGTSLAVGASCIINVVFKPDTTGVRTAILNVRDTAGKQTIALTGAGVNAVKLSTTSLAFASQTRDTISAPKIVTLTNPGSTPLSPVVTITGTNIYDFEQTNNCAALAPYGTCTVKVVFSPLIRTPLGAKSVTVIVTDRGTHQQITATGTSK